MVKGRHRKPGNWRLKYLSGLTVLALIVIAACATAAPSSSQAQEPSKATDWRPMAVEGLEYACDPVLGVIVKHVGSQSGVNDNAYPTYKLWNISVTPYTQLTSRQIQEMCGPNR